MKHLYLKNNINSINVQCRFSREELSYAIKNKINIILSNIDLNDRITTKYVQNKLLPLKEVLNPYVPPFDLSDPLNVRIFREITIDDYIEQTYSNYSGSNYLYQKKRNLTITDAWKASRDLFDKLVFIWSKEDSEDLRLISNQFTNWMEASLHYFYWKFHDDHRYDLIFDYFKNKINIKYFNLISPEYDIKTKIEYDVLRPLLEYFFYELNLKNYYISALCSISGEFYLENHWTRRYALWNLYIPFSPSVIPKYTTTDSKFKNKLENMISEEESLSNLADYCKIYQCIPTVKELNFPDVSIENSKEIIDSWLKIPYDWYYKYTFGSLKVAYFKAGVIDENALKSKFGTFTLAKDGHLCNSLAECKIDNWLFENNIMHEKEPYYPEDAIFNPKKLLRADWKVGSYYIEYFGLMNQSNYVDKVNRKKNLVKKLDLKLISLYSIDEIEYKLKILKNPNGE